MYISQKLDKTMDVIHINNGKRHRMMTYTILGSVFSGDCDTTLANTMRMALYNRYLNDKAGLKYGKDYLVWSKGDDFTVFYKPYIKDDFIRKIYKTMFLTELPKQMTIYGLGQIMKFLTIGGPDSLSFCSLKAWYKDPEDISIILTRNPEKFASLSKYSRKIKKFKDIPRANFLLQQAIALRRTYSGLIPFEIMADAYTYAAAVVIDTMKTNKTKMNLINEAMNYVNKTQGKIRRQLQMHDMMYEDKNKQLLYDIKYKKKGRKIIGQYWDYMKYIQEDFSYKLAPEQQAYINQQMLDRLDCMYLKSNLGQKNKCHLQTYQQLQQQLTTIQI
jgi:hypothetical protein